ncbi:hypothetical protein ES703_124776 [subsurface metagenome]
MLGKIDVERRGNAIFFTELKLIADAGADQPISLSFILLFFFVNLRTGSHANEPVFVGMNKQRYGNQ